MSRRDIFVSYGLLGEKDCKKKIVSLLLTVMLALLMLSGCIRFSVHVETEEKTDADQEKPDTDREAEIEALIDKADIAASRHRRDIDYMADFKTHFISVDIPSVGSELPETAESDVSPGESAVNHTRLTLHMADAIYEEGLLRDYAKALWRDLNVLEKATGAAPEELTVYLVISTINGYPVNAGAKIFCTLSDFESGAYRETLCGAVYGLTIPWQTVGLTAYAFGGPDDVEAGNDVSGGQETIDLASYYADESHVLTATCSVLHLSPLISDEETVNAARETARGLTAFLIEQEGFDSFLQTKNAAEKIPKWQESLGMKEPLQLPEGWQELTDIAIFPKKGYLAEIRVNHLTIDLMEDSWCTDPDGLYLWLLNYYAGMELVMDQIRTEAPSAFETAEQRFEESVQIIFTNVNTYTVTYPLWNEISLSNGGAIWHEMVHLLLEEYTSNVSLAWECEAIAEHFSHEAEKKYAPTQYISKGLDAYLEFFEEVSGKEATEDDMVFHRLVWTLYQEFIGPEGSEDDDLNAFCRAYGISALILDGKISRTQVRKKYDMSVLSKRGAVPGKKEFDGNALSYPESEVLFDYLAELYGIDAAVDAYLNGLSLEKAFGISYSELFNDAVAHFEVLYWKD